MQLTPLGAQVAQLDIKERKAHGTKLVKGSVPINKYTPGVCYDAAAFTRFALGAKIAPNDLVSFSGQAWQRKFAFTSGKKWNGKTSLKPGCAVGFYRLVDRKVFHAAIAVSGTKVRAVNGGDLGLGWQAVDLKKALGEPDEDGAFDFDGTKIEVYISKL